MEAALIEIMQDSSMHIVMEVENAAGDAGFIFDATYEGGHDWNEWLALPRHAQLQEGLC